MKILGLDPGFASTGWCIASYGGDELAVEAMGVIRTERHPKALVSDDNFRRAMEIWGHLEKLVAETDGRVVVDLVVFEAMSYPPSASTAAKMSLTYGAVASVCAATRLPHLQFSPGAIKLAASGSKKSSKAEVAAALKGFYLETEELLKDVPKSKQEHPLDALGAIVASLDSVLVKMFVRREK